MRRLLIVIGPLEESFLTLPVSEGRTNAGRDAARPSFWAESPPPEGQRTLSPRDDGSYEQES